MALISQVLTFSVYSTAFSLNLDHLKRGTTHGHLGFLLGTPLFSTSLGPIKCTPGSSTLYKRSVLIITHAIDLRLDPPVIRETFIMKCKLHSAIHSPKRNVDNQRHFHFWHYKKKSLTRHISYTNELRATRYCTTITSVRVRVRPCTSHHRRCHLPLRPLFLGVS
ncbi:hypothetical protein BJ138DRAFT_649683 [Hygrophoropsis aurantiaca]|uniref:Uncharacterized protein n=1 Tax=Hygrophoropsis aurantiaca TaxID=72124 RepID=A0ACB8AJA2_9AGAM|nr:hypothetical protein BJ138DRAFT_649683 [Hygrophoropsis aurantiaca]